MATLEEIRAERARRAAGPQNDKKETQGFLDWVINGDDFDIGTWLNMAGESMTLGLVGDEAAAKADELIGRGDYEERRDFYRQNEADMRENSPVASFAADVAGGLVPAAGVVGGAARAANLGRAALSGLGYGAAAGGTYGFMEGEGDLSDRVNNGLVGAAMGGALGGAAPLVGRAAGRSTQALREAWARHAANKGLARNLSVSPTASRVMSEMVDMDDPNAMRQSLQRAGPRNMLADSGPMQAGSLDTVMQAPGPAARIARQRIDQRGVDAGKAINQALDDTMGAPGGITTAQRGVRNSTQGNRTFTYDTAYAQPIDYAGGAGRALEGLQGRIPGEAIEYANKLMRVRGEQSPQIMARIADDGSVAFERLPDVRQWDYIKQALDAMARRGDGNGLMGGQTPLGSSYQALAREVRDTLKTAVPAYGEALEAGADTISRVNAIEFGSKVLNPSTTREAVDDMLQGMTGPEKTAIKQGLRQNIDDLLARVSAVASDQNVDAREAQKAIGLLTSRANREKLQSVLGDDWAQLAPKIDEALTAMGLRASVATNSRTMGRQATDAALNDAIEPGLLRQGKVVDAAKNTAATVMGASREAVAKQKASVKNELADLLTRDGQGTQILDLIEAARQNQQVSRQPALRAALLSALSTGSLASTGANQAPDWLRNLIPQL